MELQDCVSSVSRFFSFFSTTVSLVSALDGGGVSAMQLLGRKAPSLLTSSPLKIALIFRTLFNSSSSSELLDSAFSICLRGIPIAVLGLPLQLLVRSLNGSGGGGGHPWTGTQSPVSLFTIWTLAPTLLSTNWTSWSSLDSSSIGSDAKIALILAIMSSCFFFVAANLSLSSMINRSFFAKSSSRRCSCLSNLDCNSSSSSSSFSGGLQEEQMYTFSFILSFPHRTCTPDWPQVWHFTNSRSVPGLL